MLVIPAVDIRKGKCVQLVGGEPNTGGEYGGPLKASLKWEREGASCLHLVDLDAAMGEGNNLDKIREIIEKISIEIQIGGGIRTVKRALDLLNFGADRVIIGTAAFENPDFLRELLGDTESENVIVALDVKKGKIAIEGWKKQEEWNPIEMAKKFENIGVGGFLFTNIDVEGKMIGLDTATVEKLVETVHVPVIAAGGVKSINDVKKAKKAGASGLVIGTALYEDRLNYKKAMEIAQNEER